MPLTAEDRALATVVEGEFIDSDDIERDFLQWRTELDQGGEPGKVRAYRLQIDERGNIGTTKTQTRLGAYPADAYSVDELCSLLMREYLEPGTNKLAVRLIGSRPGQRGTVFNKVILLQRPNTEAPGAAGARESTATLLKAFNDAQAQTLDLIRRMTPQQQSGGGLDHLKELLAVSAMINKPNQDLMASLLPALIGRAPAAAAPADPFSSLTQLVEAAERIAQLRGGEGGGDDSLAGILRAITPLVEPALKALPAIAMARQAAPRALPGPRAPGAVPGSPAGAPGAPAAAPSPPPGPPRAPVTISDIPSGDVEVFAEVKPQIDAAVMMASQGGNPVTAADALFDDYLLDEDLSDKVYAKVTAIIARENFVDYAAAFNPAVKQHAEWFQAFRAQIVKRVAEENAAAGTTPS